MEEINKRKIDIYTTLDGKYIYKKNIQNVSVNQINDENNISTENIKTDFTIKESDIKPISVGNFQLVVIKKLPWYKKIWKGIIGIIGLA